MRGVARGPVVRVAGVAVHTRTGTDRSADGGAVGTDAGADARSSVTGTSDASCAADVVEELLGGVRAMGHADQ